MTGFSTDSLGVWGEPSAFEVTAERIAAYAEATNDPIAAHRSGDVAPPVFAIVPAFMSMLQAAFLVAPPEVALRVVHGEQDFHFHRPIRPGDVITTRVKPLGLAGAANGTRASFLLEGRDAGGQLVNEQYMTAFFRGVDAGTSAGELAPAHKFPEPVREDAAVAQVVGHLDDDQTFRYAPASGDPMPIHLDDGAARSAGLPGIIVHGLCTQAFISWVLLTELAGSDASRLRRLAVRFAKPVRPGHDLTTTIWATPTAGVYAFESEAGGALVIKDGLAEIARPDPNTRQEHISMGSLDGRVAVITGAGRGIGREHALLFAREGARVVVNDLGGANDGSGADAGPAQEVVEEIVAAGGTASANTDNVATWDGAAGLVRQAIDTYGRLDVVVNNAGILRDGFVATLTEQQWDDVIAVHLKGHFAVLRHAAEYWKGKSKAAEQVAASVVNTASASGTFMPNAGQVNYGTAKAGIAAMTLVAAQELERYGVRVNAIAPIARTRLTLATPGMGAIFAAPVAEGEFDMFSPANISPLVAYLATEKCPHNGKVFAVQGGSIQELQTWHTTRGTDTDGPWTIDDIAERTADWS